jgi:hypothetical protein
MEEAYDKDVDTKLAPEDAKFQGELAEGVDRIHLKRAHSADPDSIAASSASQTTNVGNSSNSLAPTAGGSPANSNLSNAASLDTPSKSTFQSPLKKYRPSVDYGAEGITFGSGSGLKTELDAAPTAGSGSGTPSNTEVQKPKVDDEEEL